MLMPALGFERVMNFYMPELKAWHNEAVGVYNAMHGVKNG
jgi:hypothetical protein